MGMAIDHLVGDHRRDVIETEGRGFACDLGMVDDLKQQIAQFLLERREIVAFDCVGDLVGFLDGVWRDCLEGLVDVPGTAMLPVTQPSHDLQQAGHRVLGERFRRRTLMGHGW